MDATPDLIGVLDRLVEAHCAAGHHAVEDRRLDRDGYRVMTVRVHRTGARVRLTYNGEVFSLSLPGGYDWTEFAYHAAEREDALSDLLGFLDAYADPGTHEVVVRRRFRKDRSELRVANGAVLRTRGWSTGPTT